MIALITGGAGFIGSALVRNLLQNKENTVINVDNLSYSGNLASIPQELQHQNYIFEQCDIVNKKNIFTIIQKYQPNLIFHLAAESHVDRSIEGPRAFIDSMNFPIQKSTLNNALSYLLLPNWDLLNLSGTRIGKCKSFKCIKQNQGSFNF